MRVYVFIITILGLFLLSGCDFDFTDCAESENPRECYYDAAVSKGNAYYCSLMPSKVGFDYDRDDCYFKVAQKTNDSSDCANIKHSKNGISKEVCATNIAVQTKDPLDCKILSGNEKKKCVGEIAKIVTYKDIEKLNERVRNMKKEISEMDNDDSFKEDKESDYRELRIQRNAIINAAPPEVQNEFMRAQRKQILDSLSDDDVKDAVVKEFLDYKYKNSKATVTELVVEMNRIKKEQETMKRLDDHANKLIDDLKNNIISYGTDKATGAVEDVGKAAWEWTWKKGSERMKGQMAKLERMKDTYDRASAKYQAITAQIEKFKKVYDEVNEVYGKVEKFNKLLADGKIDQGKAKVLKGAVILGKGLEYATSYVPIFGSTVSTVTKETFDATVKLATKRAQRSTSLDKCFDDPLNCDVDEISGY